MKFSELQQKFAARTQREKLILHLMFMCGLIVVWQQTFWFPAQNQFLLFNAEEKQLQKKLDDLNNILQQTTTERSYDPNAPIRQKIKNQEDKLQQMESELKSAAKTLIPADKMAETLKQILTQRPNVTLLNLSALHLLPITTSVMEGGGISKESERPLFYRHDLILTVESSFQDLVKLMEEIEHIPWVLFWEGVSYNAHAHPKVQATISIYSLTLGEGVIGG